MSVCQFMSPDTMKMSCTDSGAACESNCLAPPEFVQFEPIDDSNVCRGLELVRDDSCDGDIEIVLPSDEASQFEPTASAR